MSQLPCGLYTQCMKNVPRKFKHMVLLDVKCSVLLVYNVFFVCVVLTLNFWSHILRFR